MNEMSKELLFKMLNDMLLSRTFEEKVNEMFMESKIHGTTHLGIGQEALAGGVTNALKPQDWIMPNHRGHGHCIAKSGDVYSVMGELMGRANGCCKGLGGSMHIADFSVRNTGSTGIVGGCFPLAVGIGLAMKNKKEDAIVTCIFGDGAQNQGTFHESLNMAAIWKLPILFLCENNLYGMSVPFKYATAVSDVAIRGTAYNMPSRIIDGNNVLEVYENVKEISEWIRSGNGPFLMEAKTYRWLGHSKSDQRKYRTKDEEKEWKEKDPIKFFKNYLFDNGHMTQIEYNKMEGDVIALIEDSVKVAENTPAFDIEEAKKLIYA